MSMVAFENPFSSPSLLKFSEYTLLVELRA